MDENIDTNLFDPYEEQHKETLNLEQIIALQNKKMPNHLVRLHNVFQFDYSNIWRECGALSNSKELFSMIEETIDFISISHVDDKQKEEAYNILRMELEAIHFATASRASVVAL